MRNKEYAILNAVILILAVACSLIAYKSAHDSNLWSGDSNGYARMANNLVQHGVISLENHDQSRPFYSTMARLPGFPAALAATQIILGKSAWNYAVLNLAAWVITVILISNISLELFGFRPALLTGILASTYTTALFQATSILPEITTNMLIIIILTIYYKSRDITGIHKLCFIGIISGLAAFYREPVAPTLMIGLLTLGTNWQNRIKLNLKRLFIIGLMMSLTYTPWIVRNYRLSGKFIPVTIYASGGGTNTKALQDNGKFGLLLPLDFWEQNMNSEYYMLDMISKRVGYRYFILSGNLEDRFINASRDDLVFDPADYFPDELADRLVNDQQMQPTIKVELIFLEICKRFTRSIAKDFFVKRSLKLFAYRLFLLYSLNDTTPWTHWRYGKLIHRLNQVRWYLIEIPLIFLGIAINLKQNCGKRIFLFVFFYSLLVILNMPVEARYGILPVTLLKIQAGVGLDRIVKWILNKRN